MGTTVYEGAVYLEKDGKRTLHTRQLQAAQSGGIAETANAKAREMGIADKGTYVAVAEHFEQAS